MSAAHILACIVLGALWRRTKGSTGGGPIASWTFAPMHALPLLPLCWALDPGKVALAYILFCGVSALFLLVRADNGGDGRPLLRFGPFGLGYWWARRNRERIPEIRIFGWAMVDRGDASDIGEVWLGGSWFGAWAIASWFGWRIMG